MTEKIKSDLIKEIVQFGLVHFDKDSIDTRIDNLALSTTTLSRVLDLISSKDTIGKCVAGIGMKGIPFATMLATKFNTPLVIIKPSHNNLYEVIGDCCNRHFIIIDDTMNTGNTFINACDVIRSKNGDPSVCIAIVNTGDTIKNKHHYTDVPVMSLIHINELRDEWNLKNKRHNEICNE